MSLETFKNTPVLPGMQVRYLNNVFPLIGVNWLCGTIRLKGNLENVSADYSDCTYVIKK